MKRILALGCAAAVLIGTGAFLLKTEKFSSSPRDQLTDELAASPAGGPAASAGASSAPASGSPSGAASDPLAGTSGRASVPGAAAGAAEKPAPVDPDAYKKAPPLSEKEKSSVQTLLAHFARGERGKAALNGFIENLDKAGLKPVVAKDENPYTGKMLTVRTDEALEGTRYLHAQYFQDESANQEPFRQHISFEVRPSPDCMNTARQMVEKLFGNKLSAPSTRGEDWIEWKVDGHYTIWVKRLGPADLADNRFNAHSPADVGTCWVAKEQEPHDGQDEHVHAR